jgi:hypothetical protein
VPFFFKQWGGLRKSEAGRTFGGRTWNEMPERIAGKVLPAHERNELIARFEGEAGVQAQNVVSVGVRKKCEPAAGMLI